MPTIASTRTRKPARKPARKHSFAFPWQPDCGDGTYRNPIIYADYSDPDVVRVGKDFYLTASSFNCTPGLPVLHSKDLVNWKIIGHALKNLPHPRYAQVQPGCGVWAPAIRFHAGKYWIFFPTPDEGIYMIKSDHPAGPWSEPHLLLEGGGLIDPCPFWDDDGKAYLVHAYSLSRAGFRDVLRVRPMSPDGLKMLGEGKIVFTAPERHPVIEGPKFLKKDGWYYILAPAGGVENGWQVALRSRNIYGPYEDKIVLEQGDTSVNGPHQGALVDTADGKWWFIHFQDAGVYGRIVHLQPVHWRDGWPIMGSQNKKGICEPVLHHVKPKGRGKGQSIPQTSDEFGSSKLGLQWQWHANHQSNWHSLSVRKKWLRLYPQLASSENRGLLPNLLLQKFPVRSFTAETLLHFSPRQSGEEAGLIVTGATTATLAIEQREFGAQLVLRIDGVPQVIQANASAVVRLRVVVKDGGLCTFSFANQNGFIEFPNTFAARKGFWIGAKLGLYSSKRQDMVPSGHVDINYFRFA
jgi:beta-xylosidase